MRFGTLSRRTLLQTTLAALFALSISSLTMAQGKGGGKKGGGGEDPPTPPVFTVHPELRYELSLIGYPNNAVAASGEVWALNDFGCAVGTYWTATSGTHSWFYDPILNPSQAIDLRDISGVQLPEGARFLVRGMNDIGVVVGGIVYKSGDIDGFALDTTTGDLEILPTDPTWNYAVGIEINNSGDILGRINRNDGTNGNYLYNRGAEGVEPTLEIVNVPDVRVFTSHLNKSADGETTIVVGVTNDGRLFIHSENSGTEITDISAFGAHVNDSGTVFGTKPHTFEVQVRKNKTEMVTEPHFYRLTETDGLKTLSDATPVFDITDMNNSEVAVGRHHETVSSNSGTYYFFYVLTHVKNLGVIDIGESVVDADKALWDTLFRDVGFSDNLAVNNAGPEGKLAGQIIGASDQDVSCLFLLTPVLK